MVLLGLITSATGDFDLYKRFYCAQQRALDISQPRPESRDTSAHFHFRFSLCVWKWKIKERQRKCLLISVPTHFYVCCALFSGLRWWVSGL